MKILMPIKPDNDISQEREFIDADEFYIGFMDKIWDKTFGEYVELNKMSSFGNKSNFSSYLDIIKIADKLHQYKKIVYVTINSASYNKEQQDYIIELAKKINSHVDGFIVGDMSLIYKFCENKLNVVVSTIAGCYNSSFAKLLFNMGVKRIILPRDLSLDEISNIVHDVPGKYEVFLMGNGCIYSDSACLGFHSRQKGSLCSYLKISNRKIYCKDKNFKNINDSDTNKYIYDTVFHKSACGLCAIYDFLELNIDAVKIVGRADSIESNIKLAKLVKQNIDIAKKCKNREEYLQKMMFPENKLQLCALGMQCYYPEVRFGGE